MEENNSNNPYGADYNPYGADNPYGASNNHEVDNDRELTEEEMMEREQEKFLQKLQNWEDSIDKKMNKFSYLLPYASGALQLASLLGFRDKIPFYIPLDPKVAFVKMQIKLIITMLILIPFSLFIAFIVFAGGANKVSVTLLLVSIVVFFACLTTSAMAFAKKEEALALLAKRELEKQRRFERRRSANRKALFTFGGNNNEGSRGSAF